MLGLHCTHSLRHQYPSTPYLLFSTYPRTVRGPRRARFYCSTLMQQQSAQLWTSSVQLYNGPLCISTSYRKIGGKASVQQSPSRRAHRTPSPRMHNVTVHEKQNVNEEQTNPAAAPPKRNYISAIFTRFYFHPRISTHQFSSKSFHPPFSIQLLNFWSEFKCIFTY